MFLICFVLPSYCLHTEDFNDPIACSFTNSSFFPSPFALLVVLPLAGSRSPCYLICVADPAVPGVSRLENIARFRPVDKC